MRPAYTALNALATNGLLGASPWIPVDYLQLAFGVGLAVTFSSGATATATVQHTFDDLNQIPSQRAVTVSQTTTVITVTDGGPYAPQGGVYNGLANHGLSAGDYVHLYNTGIPSGDGDYSVATVISPTQYTVTSAVSQSAAGGPSTTVVSARVFNHSSLAALTTRSNGSYAFPIIATRLLLTAYTGGVVVLGVVQGLGH
jgi:hypothetical protein